MIRGEHKIDPAYINRSILLAGFGLTAVAAAIYSFAPSLLWSPAAPWPSIGPGPISTFANRMRRKDIFISSPPISTSSIASATSTHRQFLETLRGC